jgi:hypothetical protein
MKNPFKRPKSQSLEDRRQARADLAFKLQKAQDDLSGARNDAVQAARARFGDAEQAAAEDKIRRCEIHVLTLENALLAEDVEIEEAEAAERVAADQALRKETADDLERRAAQLEEAAAPLAGVLANISAALSNCIPVVGEIGMPTFIGELGKTIPDGLAVIVAEVKARASATRAGSAPAILAKTVPTLVPATEPAPGPTIQIFALEPLKWKPAGPGELSQASAFAITALPVKYAKIALEHHFALEPDDPRVRNIIRNPHGPSAGIPRWRDLDHLDTVNVYSAGSGKFLREEIPGEAPTFENFRKNEAPKKVWVSRPADPQPDPSSDPNAGIFDDPA